MTCGSAGTPRLLPDTWRHPTKPVRGYDSQKIAVDGSDIEFSWGSKKKSAVPDCSVAGYMKAGTDNCYTPNLSVC